MKIDLQKSLENVRKQMGVYTPTAADAGKIDLNKSLETVRTLQQQQKVLTAQRLEEDKRKARKMQTSPLSARAAETLAGLQEGGAQKQQTLGEVLAKPTPSYPRLSIGERVGQTLAGLQEGTSSTTPSARSPFPVATGKALGGNLATTADTADQYGRGVIQNKIDELRNKGLQTDENGLGYFDTPEGEAELNAGLHELQSALRVLTGQDVTISGLAAAQDVLDSTPTINWGRWAQVDANAGQAMQAIEDRKDTEARSAYEDYYNDWLHLMEREDFAEKSRYRSTATGEEYKPGTAMFGSSGFGDLMYDYINKNQTAVERQQLLDTTSGFSALGLDQSFLQTMNDTEVGIYNYLYATEGRDRANEYLQYIKSSLTARQREQAQDWFRQYAQENPVKASAFSVLLAPARGLAYLGQTADLLTDGRIDQNAAYNKFADIPSAIRETVSQNWGPEGSFLYQTGMSMADFLLTLGISGGSNLSLAIMGSGAAADTVIDAKDRGLSDAQAFTLGTVAGVAEALTEKVSIESLLDMTTLGKSAVGYIVKNALAEAGEEASSGIINLLTDIIVSRDKSQWQQEIDRYFAQGMTKRQAVNLALMNQAKSIGLDALGGALSGGLLAGGGAITNRVGEVQRQQDQLQSGLRLYGTLQELQEAAEMGRPLSQAAPDSSPSQGEPLAEDRKDAANQQRVDISPAVNQQGFEQAQNMPVQNNAQTVDINRVQNQQVQNTPVQNEAENGDIMETPVEMRENLMGGTEYGQTGTEAKDGADLLLGGGQERGSGQIDQGGAGPLERNGQTAAARGLGPSRTRGEELRALTELVKRNGLQPYGSAELGVEGGTETKRNYVLDDESMWTDEMRSIKNHYDELNRERREKYGYKEDVTVTFIMGQIEFEDVDGNVQMAEGMWTGTGEVLIQVNNSKRTATQIAEHEEYHMLEAETPGLTKATWDVVGELGINDALVEQYRRFYTRTMGYSDDMIREEILADAYAGINRTGVNMNDVRDLVRQMTTEAKEAIDQGWYDPYAEEAYESVDSEGRETRGPPEMRYSVNEGFTDDIDEWNELGRQGNYVFVLGSTGEVLQGLGAIESDIYMNGDKINTILAEHPEMTLTQIKQIPQLLDDPTLILKSKGVGKESRSSRVVVFGSVVAENGQPVLAVLDLKPRENGFELSDMQKVNSAYTKKNPAAFLNASEAMYVDEKRTAPLLRRFGLTIASRELLRSGYVGSITYNGDAVNIEGTPWGELIAENEEAASGARYSATEETADDTAYRERYEAGAANRAIDRAVGKYQMTIREIFPAQTAQARKAQRQQLENLGRLLSQNGEITQQDIDDAFDELWDSAREVDNEMATQYKDLKQELKAGVKVSEAVKKDIADYGAYRKSHIGTVGMTNSGLEIDEAYADWNSRYPEFFPDDIINPTDQLERMAEVAKMLLPKIRTMDEVYRGDPHAKTEIKVEFVDMVKAMEADAKRSSQTRLPRENDLQWDPNEDRRRAREKMEARPEEQWDPNEFEKPEAERAPMLDEATAMEMARDALKQTARREESEYAEFSDKEPGNWEMDEEGVWEDRDARMEAEVAANKAEKLRRLAREGFRGAESLKNLGVRIAGSEVDYTGVKIAQQLHKSARTIRNQTAKLERRLNATAEEKALARGIAAGANTELDIKDDQRRDVVMDLVDAYMQEQLIADDMIRAKRNVMYAEVDASVQELMKDKEANKVSSMIILNQRTPLRNMIRMFGKEQGQKIYNYFFKPVSENEAERLRWVNKMYDEVRLVEGSDGKRKQLNKKERELTQFLMEGRAAAQSVETMMESQAVMNAANNLRNGQAIEDAAREFGLNKNLQNAAADYARWLDTQDALRTAKNVDVVRIENAVELYAKQYDRFYEAINDFLVAHGYEPIGFIKGYAPHLQTDDSKNLLKKALNAMGITDEVASLPASIAGLTHTYRPNKRWNPFFLSRTGDTTEYDVAKGYQSYVDYLSDILYHMDDTVRIRRASNYFRRTYAPDSARENIEQAEWLRTASTELKEEFLRENGEINAGDVLSADSVDDKLDEYIKEQYAAAENATKYSNLVNWLEDYANQLTGKQYAGDRGMEYDTGRRALNIAGKLNKWFQQANVAANISSMLNQTAQLPMIVSDIGYANTAIALKDYAKGIFVRDGFREKSDFLTAKKGTNDLVIEPAAKVLNIMFTPVQIADDLMSSVATRAAYIKAVRQGMNDAEAMKFADKKAEQIMGSRAKGSAPQGFRSRDPIKRMVRMFQIEALNAFEYVEQDIIIQGIKDIKQIDDTKGRAKATAALVGLITKMLVSAFLWNRATEELYGGSPAQFDIFGYAANFLASGNGITPNQQLLDWINMAWERMTGEELFEMDLDYNEEFDWVNAGKDLFYDVSSDLPFLRNAMGVAGWGDQSLPMPDFSKIKDAAETAIEVGATAETLDKSLAAIGEFLPGGRQINKTYQGARTMIRGGRYYGYGENERLQYPVEDTTSNWIKALLFGPSGLSENTAFYAAGGDDGLSAGNTRKYQELMQVGMSSEMAMEVYEEYRRINRLESMTASEKATEFANTLDEMGIPEEQKTLAREAFMFWDMVPGEATKYDTFVEEGLDPEMAYELTETLGELEPEDGKTSVSNLQKYQAVLEMTDVESTRYAALAGLMQDKELARLRAAYDYVQSGTYVEFLTAFDEAYPGETKSQERVETVLRQMRLDAEERAALWQMCGPKWKTDNNPFSKSVGREVAALIEEYYAEIDGE